MVAELSHLQNILLDFYEKSTAFHEPGQHRELAQLRSYLGARPAEAAFLAAVAFLVAISFARGELDIFPPVLPPARAVLAPSGIATDMGG
jgi:hypothetical protein